MTRIALTLFAAALTLPAVASARGGGGACRADAQRLCADDLGDRKAVKRCLKANQDQLSEACAERIERRKARRQAFKAACAEDKARLCGDVEPGQGRIRECMKANADQLSPACGEAVSEMKGRRGKRGRKGKGVCRADVQRLCADHKGDRQAVRQCLADNQDQLSEACAARVEKKQARRAAFEAACGADKAQFCGDVEPGKRRIRQCMKAHADELSQGCSDFLAERKAARRARRGERRGR